MTNTKSRHTPGPWGVFGAQDSSSDEWRALTVAEASMPFMRVCFMPSDGTEVIMANARLIAAAPDLLQALIDLGDWLACGMNKAAGAEPTAEDHAACERVAAQARAAIDKATKQ